MQLSHVVISISLFISSCTKFSWSCPNMVDILHVKVVLQAFAQKEEILQTLQNLRSWSDPRLECVMGSSFIECNQASALASKLVERFVPRIPCMWNRSTAPHSAGHYNLSSNAGAFVALASKWWHHLAWSGEGYTTAIQQSQWTWIQKNQKWWSFMSCVSSNCTCKVDSSEICKMSSRRLQHRGHCLHDGLPPLSRPMYR